MKLSGAIGLLALCHAAGGQEPEAPDQPRPCQGHPELARFDFWVGSWDVQTADGRPAGVNDVTKEEAGCALVERWTSVRGGTGMSLNHYDPATGEWVQNWVGADGSVIDIRGGLQDDGSMLLDGFISYVGRAGRKRFRGRWTPLSDGRVRQAFEESDDDGATWNEWFVGLYTRRTPSGE